MNAETNNSSHTLVDHIAIDKRKKKLCKVRATCARVGEEIGRKKGKEKRGAARRRWVS